MRLADGIRSCLRWIYRYWYRLLVSAIAVHGNVILTAAGTDIAVHRLAAVCEQECASCCSISGNSDGGRQIG